MSQVDWHAKRIKQSFGCFHFMWDFVGCVHIVCSENRFEIFMLMGNMGIVDTWNSA